MKKLILGSMIFASIVAVSGCKKCQTCEIISTNISSGTTNRSDYGEAECDREGRNEQKANCEKAAQDGTSASYTKKCECKTN